MFCSIKTSTEDFPAMFESSDERLNHCLMKQAIWEDITFQTHPHIIASRFILFFRYMPLNITGWWYTYPSEKYEFVSWDDDIPNIWKNKSNVPNSQPVQISWFHGNVILHPIPLPDGWMTTEWRPKNPCWFMVKPYIEAFLIILILSSVEFLAIYGIAKSHAWVHWRISIIINSC